MTESQRIDYLIKRLEGNNARSFAQKCGIPTSSLSRARNGQATASIYFQRILDAYPEVSSKWLFEGSGQAIPGDIEQVGMQERIDKLEKEVRRLARLIEKIDKRI